jgi:cytochrome b subunit of formate dehydrogenase
MFVLLFTAFLPVVGVQFAWVTWHWIAGLVLTGSIVFHIVHASVWLDFWSIWVGPKDIPELKAELLRELGHDVPGPKPGKYPLGNRLYHTVIVVAGLAAVVTGILMTWRVRTPFFTRNLYLFSDRVWGFTYVLHGLAGVGLVGLVIAHVYFAVPVGAGACAVLNAISDALGDEIFRRAPVTLDMILTSLEAGRPMIDPLTAHI